METYGGHLNFASLKLRCYIVSRPVYRGRFVLSGGQILARFRRLLASKFPTDHLILIKLMIVNDFYIVWKLTFRQCNGNVFASSPSCTQHLFQIVRDDALKNVGHLTERALFSQLCSALSRFCACSEDNKRWASKYDDVVAVALLV